jgi:NAD(P)H dehydrogenase (quinone)
MYAITGASGQLGRLVIEHLMKTVPADQIVAAVRTPAKAQDLADRGVVVREADYDQPNTLASAFKGVEKLLLISSTEVSGRLPQHRAVINAAVEADVRLLAYTSMLHANTSSARLAIEHRETEEAIAVSRLPAVILRNGWYIENSLMALPMALAHGAFVGSSGDGRFSSAARDDYAAAAAVALTSPDQTGRVYELAGDHAFNMIDLAAEVSRRSGKAIAYNDLPVGAYEDVLIGAGLPKDLSALLADADAAASRGALFDDNGALSALIGRPTTTMPSLVATAINN